MDEPISVMASQRYSDPTEAKLTGFFKQEHGPFPGY